MHLIGLGIFVLRWGGKGTYICPPVWSQRESKESSYGGTKLQNFYQYLIKGTEQKTYLIIVVKAEK